MRIENTYEYTQKLNGQTLDASEWNALAQAVATTLTAVNEIGETSGSGDGGIVTTEVDANDNEKTYIKVNNITVAEFTDKGNKGTNITVSGNNNINIEPRAASGTGEAKNTPGDANRKGGNISLKPGDDIELCSHKRGTSKNTEVAVKVMDGSENPVKLQLMAGEITLSTKGKDKTKKKDANGADTNVALYDDPNVMNVNVVTGEGKGYLKVRAQAIDLRCEDHGGIAIQPKGFDGTETTRLVLTNVFYGATSLHDEIGYGIGIEKNTFMDTLDSINNDSICKIYLSNYVGTYSVGIGNSLNQKINIDLNGQEITNNENYAGGSNGKFTITVENLKRIITQNGNITYLIVYSDSRTNNEIENVSEAILEIYKPVAGNMNKIKFEHGGGDGLEFGTFNAEKTSIFTDEYRFNKNGVLKLADRRKYTSDKKDVNDPSTYFKYEKQADDFYDIINQNDPTCTWEDIISIISELKLMRAAKTGPWTPTTSD